jgi:hypothetical protein
MNGENATELKGWGISKVHPLHFPLVSFTQNVRRRTALEQFATIAEDLKE